MNVLDRNSNNINIATFWENYQLKKYNFNPSYQRPSDVWSEAKKSFLIDTIFKNFPMPPVFLHQHIDVTTGKTIYDVIDGKQRLTTIISFIENSVSLPENFSEDTFGDDRLNGLFFRDLEATEYSEWKKVFWKYELSIEYIDTDQNEIVTNIFDRLNRNGEPLTFQELRNAKYHNSPFYNLIVDCSNIEFWQPLLNKLEKNRLEHHEFIAELLFIVMESQINSSDKPSSIDDLFSRYALSDLQEKIDYSEKFILVTSVMESFNLDYELYRITGVSHLYGLFALAWTIYERNSDIEDLEIKLKSFYTMLRNKDENQYTKDYQISMNAGTKSRARRVRRLNSLLEYLNQEKYE